MSASWTGDCVPVEEYTTPEEQEMPSELVEIMPLALTYDPASELGKAVATVYSIAGAVVGNSDRVALIKVLVEFEHNRAALDLAEERINVCHLQREAALSILDKVVPERIDADELTQLVHKIRTALLELPDGRREGHDVRG